MLYQLSYFRICLTSCRLICLSLTDKNYYIHNHIACQQLFYIFFKNFPDPSNGLFPSRGMPLGTDFFRGPAHISEQFCPGCLAVCSDNLISLRCNAQ